MRADLLTVIAVYANPYRWRNRLANFRRFEEHMIKSGVNLVTVECTYGDRPFELDEEPPFDTTQTQRVRVRSRDVLWHKENLLNIGIARTSGDYIATIDGDFTFVDLDWASETVHMLQLHPVVQISSELVFQGPNKEHLHTTQSLVSLHHQKIAGRLPAAKVATTYYYGGALKSQHGYPGGAWAYRRDTLDKLGGLLDFCIVGAGDHHMAQGLLGNNDALAHPSNAGEAYARKVQVWRNRAAEAIKRDVGLVPGIAIHHWHGRPGDRKYPSRWKILQNAQFNPETDVLYDSQGLLQLAGNKPGLRDDLRAYFQSRNEDATEAF